MTSNAQIHFDRVWRNEIKPKVYDMLEEILDAGLKPGPTLFESQEKIDIFDICYDMCNPTGWNCSKRFYRRYGETIENYLAGRVLPTILAKTGQGATILLKELHHRWINNQVMNKCLQEFFFCVDAFHAKKGNVPTLLEVGLASFRAIVYDETKVETTTTILALINQERQGEIVDQPLIKSIVELYATMGMGTLDAYMADLEEPLLTNTRDFYVQRRQAWMNDSTPDYLIKAEEALNEESKRVADYLNSSSEGKIIRVVEKELLQTAQTTLLEKETSGCCALLENDKLDDLQRMFRLFKRLDDGLAPMAAIFQQFIIDSGNECVTRRKARLDSGEKDAKEDTSFIKSMIELHEKYLGVVKKDFDGHPLFQKALKDALVVVINKDVGIVSNAELLSAFCDRVLKSGGETLKDAKVEEDLNQAIQVFSYLLEKDKFAEAYRNLLACQ